MLIKSARAKGKQFERDVAEFITNWTNVKFRRTPCSGGIRGVFPGDIMKMEQKPTIFDDVLLEMKDQNQISMPTWIKQTESEAIDANLTKWLIFFKHKGKIYVTLPMPYLEKLIKG